MMGKQRKIREFYKRAFTHFGNQNWWPAESKLECAIGAILTQNTSWKNAEKAINTLKDKSLIDMDKLHMIPTNDLSYLIRPSGYYRIKAKRLKNFIKFIIEKYDGKIENMLKEKTDTLRDELLCINGIGPETADTIILYALEIPVFVIDKYTYRILTRHGLIPGKTTYQEMQKLMEDSIEKNHEIYNEFHALIVKVGKEHCKKTPQCTGCPLEYDIRQVLCS